MLLKGFRLCAGKRALSIASAGDNALALLSTGAEVVAVDLNPAQLACAELRREAIRAFTQPEFLSFAGVLPCKDRWERYQKIRQALTPGVQLFWDAKVTILEQGFIHAGKFERYFHLFRKYILPLIHRKSTIAALLQQRAPEARSAFYFNVWNNRRWRFLFRVFFSRHLMGALGRDPAFFRHVEGDVASRILERAQRALTTLDNACNPYLSYILTGNYDPALPWYLRKEHYGDIQKNLDRLTLHLGSVDAIARHYGPSSFDAFNLSDIFEYLTVEQCHDVYAQLLDSARPGARLAYWNMLVPRQCPAVFAGRVKRLEEEADRLYVTDMALFYSRFNLEEVLPCP